MKRAILILGAVALLLGSVGQAKAGLITTRPSGDVIDWSQLGTNGTVLVSPQTFTSTGSITGSVNDGASATTFLQRLDQSTGWGGNFAPREALLWNRQNGNAIELNFNTPVSQAGAQIQDDFFGSFTATISAFDSLNNLLGTFTENGNSTGAADDSAIYIGVAASGISRITFSVSGGGNGINDLAINHVTINGDVSAVPEPATMTLLGFGIAGLAGYGWRKRKQAVTV